MKFTLIAVATALQVNDAPAYFDAEDWNERMPSAAGFVQLSACQENNVSGIVCEPNFVQFATGMNGDEDLGQDITMKGEPFHFNQQSLAQDAHTDQFNKNLKFNKLGVDTDPHDLPICTGTNGPVGVNCQREDCTGTNGPMDGPASSGCIRAEPDSIPHYNDDPVAGRPYQTTGDQTHTEQVPGFAPYGNPNDATQFGNQNNEQAFDVDSAFTMIRMMDGEDKLIPDEPEKVSVLESPVAKSHTTFYPQGKH